MKLEDHTLSEITQIAARSLEVNKQVDLSSPEIRERIENELKPVLKSLSSVMQEVAITIAGKEQNHSALINKMNHIFSAYECRVSFDLNNEFTNTSNPASIQFRGGKLQLKINQDFTDLTDTKKKNQFLRELVHELGALLLLQNLEQDIGFKIISQEILQVYKSRLTLTGTNIGLTHILDTVLLLLIKEYRKKQF